MRTDNMERWHRRMEQAAALLSARLEDPPSLEELAAAAVVSPFHFHRIWRGLTGESVGETLSRLRAEAAQALLAEGQNSITEVAMMTGYSSSQSFARAFRRQTGLSASEAISGSAPLPPPSIDPPVKLEVRDGVKVVALRREGGAYVQLNALFQAVWDWAEGEGVLGQLEGLYGIPLDDPGSVAEAALRYDACMAFGPVEPPAPLRLVALPHGPHAVLRCHGSYDALEPLDQWLVGTWLPASGHEPADAPLYHHFHNDPESTPEAQLVTDILLPLQEREDG